MRTDSTETRTYFVHTLLRARNFQERPEFSQLCHWWRSGGKGVCALVGIGGAGKTALVDEFLRCMPRVTADSGAGVQRSDLQTPRNLFVYSFYNSPNPEDLFRRLIEWVQRDAEPARKTEFSSPKFH